MPGVKRGDWVVVKDAVAFDGYVVVVIGVIAVIRVARNDAAGEMLRAVEIRRCTPRFDEIADEMPAQLSAAQRPQLR